MKVLAILLFASSLASSLVLAQDNTQAQCAKQVDASVSAIELVSKQTGTEKKLGELSVPDIRAMQKTRGGCATMQEINKQLMK